MNTSIRTSFGFGLALYLIAGGPSSAQSTSTLGNLGGEPDNDSQSIEPATVRPSGPPDRTTIRIIDPENREQVGTILYGISGYALLPPQDWGGPR
jgi:hypothetical protein